MNSRQLKTRTRSAKQAREWFVTNQSGVLDEEQNAAFLAWLRASPLHIQNYLRVAQIMEEVKALKTDAEVSLEEFLTRSRAQAGSALPRSRPGRWFERSVTNTGPRLALIAAAIGATSLGLVWWEHVSQRANETALRTMHGELLVSRLPDGSTVHLDSDSAVVLRYTSQERLVELAAGRSFFEVVHDEKRRFRVQSGDAGAIAVGTRFEVTRDKYTTIITVADGEVAVFSGTPRWLSTASETPPEVSRVVAGYALRVDGKNVADTPVRVDMAQSLGWLEHKIVFENRPLNEVAQEFNRYSPIQIEVDDSVRDLPMSGSFEVNDAESFVRFLGTLPGIKVERMGTRIRIVADVK
jgi:transmembrane sensor